MVYLLDKPGKHYVLLDLDPIAHYRNGLLLDLFRINWFGSERFASSKVYVVRLNHGEFEYARTGSAECCS